ncbi:SDR family oxidoreductase [Ammonicoccus fulvus]|uniref:SDR family oxidoreductase n=1 Tax=Ammonicoccus fulvus TaxID=3138240 RepID=A0ABZ3FIQ3_9ACTN
MSGFRPQPHNVAYVAAKHGVIGLTKVAALEHGKDGIRVNAVAPGAIDTPMLQSALHDAGINPEEFAPALSLLGRFAAGREIAQACLWLASDLSSYVTATCIDVDAGYTNR